MNRYFTIIIFCLLVSSARGQTDNIFWFAAPDVSSVHGDPPQNGAPINLHITAVQATDVTVSQPANPGFTPITFHLNAMQHRSIQLNAIMGIDQIENYPQTWPQPPASIQKKAFKITSSPGDITAYYELDNYYNRDIFTLKGKNAMGKDFYVSTENYFPNGTGYGGTTWSGMVLAATENNTRIVVYPNDDWLYFSPHPDSVVLTLNAGETFAFRAASTAANRHINGVRVKSNKNIVVTWYDDSVRKKNTNTASCNNDISYDICGDQDIPLTLIGKEYLVMKGQIIDAVSCDRGERIFITTTQPNTGIYINGVLVITIPNAGTVYNYMLTTNTTRVRGTQPIYINHLTGFGGEMGGAVLPTIDGCTGSYDVTFTRTPNASDAFFLNIMGRNITTFGDPKRNKTAKSFTITSGGVTTPIPEAYFDYLTDSSWVILKKTAAVNSFIASKILPGNEATVSNSVARFHLGVINGGAATGCKYGYFSDYKSDFANAGIGGANATKLQTYCSFDPIHLVANGGIAYKWFGETSPGDTSMLSSTRIADPYFSPVVGGYYRFGVTVTRECYGDTIIHLGVYVVAGPVAQFDVATAEGCSPFKAVFSNETDPVKAVENYWNFDTRYSNTVPQSTLTNPFTWEYPENHTDSLQHYTVRLTVKGEFGMCPNRKEKVITVKPNVDAGFFADNNVGCSPLLIHFTDTSLGVIDTLNSYWDFITYQKSYEPNPSFSFENNRTIDTTYDVKLITYSNFGCIDTAIFPITVHPYINATFGINQLTGCSPFMTTVNPLGSVGVQTFHWSIHDINRVMMDSVFTRNNYNTFNFNHNDDTQPNPDTLYIDMYGENGFGCADTAINKRLIIFPEVHSLFTESADKICDSVNVQFTNNSIGYRPMFEWNLGDGSLIVDTLKNNFIHKFFNRTTHTIDYPVRLITTSDYFCRDTLIDTVRVYPFVKANFAIDYTSNCSPLNVMLVNTSKGGNQFDWNFGDGNGTTTFAPDTMFHSYENNTDFDTTYYLNLRAENGYGCADSLQRSVFLFPQVVAGFNFNSPSVGCNPLNVSFLNNSRGKDLDYTWNFGDNTFSTSQFPSPKNYINPKSYDTTYYVTLTVVTPEGCDSSLTRSVRVYSKVTADFSIARLDSCSPFKINLQNLSFGGITDFIWKYTPTDSITLHSFADPIIPVYENLTTLPVQYGISLRTRNSHGCSALKRDTITIFPEVFASFHPDYIAGCQPLKINFINNTNIIGGTNFFWNFGDGKYSNQVTPPRHTFGNLTNLNNFHNVHLEATSQYGCYDDTTIAVEVYPYIYAKFSIDKPAICSDEPFGIDRSSSAGAINHYYWDYDNDGTPEEDKTDAIFDYTYTNTGNIDLNRSVNLTVTNAEGCDTSWLETMVVHPEVRAAFSVDATQICYPKINVFTNNSAPSVPLTYYWDFGDGSSAVQQNPTHGLKNYSHTNDETFTVKLTATSEYGCDSTISRNITVHPKPLSDFTFPLSADCPPFTVPFTNNSQGLSLDYFWDFDNGVNSTDLNPSQLFNNFGSTIEDKNISLIITTDFNCQDTAIKPLRVYPGVTTDFNASAWTGCNPLNVNLDGTATNEDEYFWYVDDKVISNYEDLSYRFLNDAGANQTYNIKFRAVSLNGCSSETVKQITVYPKPLAEFLPRPQVQDYNITADADTVYMNNSTSNQSAWNYHWDFGDHTTSTDGSATVEKIYGANFWGDINDENRILVNLIATNSANPECSDTVQHYIIINPPLPQVNILVDISGCMPLTVDFPSVTKYNYPGSYQWDFGNGSSSTNANPSDITYDTAGIYIVRLAVTGDGGTNWDYKRVTVYPKPIVDFSFAPNNVRLASQTEKGTPVKFFNTAEGASTYSWNFGDSIGTSTDFQPVYEYPNVGTFYVTLTASSTEGCSDYMKSSIPVEVEGCDSLFFPTAIIIDPSIERDEYFTRMQDNDPSLFRPLAKGIEKYRLEIYNRWGELIYVSEDVFKGWNGYIKGKPAKQDVYVWRVTGTFSNGKPFRKAGNVTLLIKKPGTN